MRLRYLTENGLQRLKLKALDNIQAKKYEEDKPWVDESWSVPSNLVIPDIQLKASVHPNGKRPVHFDLENVCVLYGALKHLTPAEASNERLWAQLTHTTFWAYMRSRWPVDHGEDDEEEVIFEEEKGKRKGSPLKRVEARYFLSGQKAPVRNGLARLWWFGYMTYDESLGNPWELTEILLHNSDLTLNLTERNFSRNLEFTKTILETIAKIKIDNPVFYNRDRFRELMKHFNYAGGVSIVDLFDSRTIERAVKEKLTS
ncbi:DUF6339 family protein [Paenibacillus sp. Y412MC10]|uniref:DUF6339 family protein n=1 Tax=Geobacillus sp. (strain Y412MC10) TaxID=481743 RepID=UPI0011AA5B13|nr:DUF6339 family protein [Paenibacillus sp. Y412MC10]